MINDGRCHHCSFSFIEEFSISIQTDAKITYKNIHPNSET
jgi:hypothetical protein